MTDHPWKLVAPWYRWGRQAAADGTPPARSRPVFHKYDAPAFARDFTRDPQRSLRFEPTVDEVMRVHTAAEAGGAPWKRLFVASPERGKAPVAFHATLVATGRRKLYLPTHQRFYLVACELRCDLPGFPPAVADKPCQAGFVVRRRSAKYPTGLRADAAAKLKAVHDLQARLGYLDGSTPLRGRPADLRAARVKQFAAAGTLETTLADVRTRLAAAHAALADWQDAKGVVHLLEGWIPGAQDGVGAWRAVADTPELLEEAWFPLYRVFAPPAEPAHAAAGRALYYGVVPTSSLDVEPRGAARFGPEVDYEVRCFVRRHARECPPSKAVPDCHGPLVWSEPTELYQLAAPADLIGTSQRPVTIRMPDLAELAAQAASLDPATLAPVRFEQPQQLNFEVDDQKAKGGSVGGFPQICFFAIPLITLVAFFVLRLFLPVLVFLFNLYFLLAFRLCILPSFGLAAGADLEGKVTKPDVELDADLTVSASVGNQMRTLIEGTLEVKPSAAPTALAAFLPSALKPLGKQIVVAEKAAKDDPTAAAFGPKPLAEREYEVRVEVTP